LIKDVQPDLILTGVQAHNDLDGPVGPLLAEYLGLPYVGYVAGITVSADHVVVRKEYAGGLIAEMEVKLPAVLGIQAAEQPPRYVAYSKIRQVMGTAKIEERAVASLDTGGAAEVSRMFQPEVAERATMLEGGADQIADSLVSIFKNWALCEREAEMSQDILVVIEHLQGKVLDISFVMLAAARQLARNTGGSVTAVLLGFNAQGLAGNLSADKVFYVDQPALAEFTSDAYQKH